MRIRYLVIAATAIGTVAAAQSHYTHGYTRKDGTYVAPHMQTNPNSTKLDNWTTKGNVNPYTGKSGTVDPYKPTTSNPYGSPYNSGNSSGGY